MNTKHFNCLFSLMLALWASALSAQTHWSVNPTDFSNHMTIYYGLQSGELPIADLGNYEIAAFVGNECRGVGTVETQDSHTYGCLFVYGSTEGENISFKFYDKTTMEEKNIAGASITFSFDGQVGYPSSPQMFDVGITVLLGDVNDDGKIDTVDLSLLINKILGIEDPRFIDAAGDLNGDGNYDTVDLALLINLILNQ